MSSQHCHPEQSEGSHKTFVDCRTYLACPDRWCGFPRRLGGSDDKARELDDDLTNYE
jgi:hypothetical protein